MAIRIALVDHHLNNWHADTFLRLLREGKVTGAEIVAAWESDPTGEDWCAKNRVRRAASIEDAAKDADAVMVLAPDNIAHHKPFFEKVAPLGKPTFLDKYLAPNVADAKAIVALAEKRRIPLLCSSALRYAQEVIELLADAPRPVTDMFARGMGEWSGYGIHTVSPVVRAMGGGVRRINDVGTPASRFIALDYGEGRRATIEVRAADNGYHAFPWQFGIRSGKQFRTAEVKDFDRFYSNQLKAVVDFFQTKQPDITPQEAISVVAILEGAEKSQKDGGKWVSVGA